MRLKCFTDEEIALIAEHIMECEKCDNALHIITEAMKQEHEALPEAPQEALPLELKRRLWN